MSKILTPFFRPVDIELLPFKGKELKELVQVLNLWRAYWQEDWITSLRRSWSDGDYGAFDAYCECNGRTPGDSTCYLQRLRNNGGNGWLNMVTKPYFKVDTQPEPGMPIAHWAYYPEKGFLMRAEVQGADEQGVSIEPGMNMTQLLFWFKECYPQSGVVNVMEVKPL